VCSHAPNDGEGKLPHAYDVNDKIVVERKQNYATYKVKIIIFGTIFSAFKFR
jgi:hypothetical protein